MLALALPEKIVNNSMMASTVNGNMNIHYDKYFTESWFNHIGIEKSDDFSAKFFRTKKSTKKNASKNKETNSDSNEGRNFWISRKNGLYLYPTVSNELWLVQCSRCDHLLLPHSYMWHREFMHLKPQPHRSEIQKLLYQKQPKPPPVLENDKKKKGRNGKKNTPVGQNKNPLRIDNSKNNDSEAHVIDNLYVKSEHEKVKKKKKPVTYGQKRRKPKQNHKVLEEIEETYLQNTRESAEEMILENVVETRCQILPANSVTDHKVQEDVEETCLQNVTENVEEAVKEQIVETSLQIVPANSMRELENRLELNCQLKKAMNFHLKRTTNSLLKSAVNYCQLKKIMNCQLKGLVNRYLRGAQNLVIEYPLKVKTFMSQDFRNRPVQFDVSTHCGNSFSKKLMISQITNSMEMLSLPPSANNEINCKIKDYSGKKVILCENELSNIPVAENNMLCYNNLSLIHDSPQASSSSSKPERLMNVNNGRANLWNPFLPPNICISGTTVNGELRGRGSSQEAGGHLNDVITKDDYGATQPFTVTLPLPSKLNNLKPQCHQGPPRPHSSVSLVKMIEERSLDVARALTLRKAIASWASNLHSQQGTSSGYQQKLTSEKLHIRRPPERFHAHHKRKRSVKNSSRKRVKKMKRNTSFRNENVANFNTYMDGSERPDGSQMCSKKTLKKTEFMIGKTHRSKKHERCIKAIKLDPIKIEKALIAINGIPKVQTKDLFWPINCYNSTATHNKILSFPFRASCKYF